MLLVPTEVRVADDAEGRPTDLQRQRVLDLTLRSQRRDSIRISLARDTWGEFRMTLDGHVYAARLVETTLIAPPGEAADFGVTVATAFYRTEAATGSLLIVINCSPEPPVLQITVRPQSSGLVHTWSSEITHDIQRQLIGFLEDAGLPSDI